jgi:hypothetical protein
MPTDFAFAAAPATVPYFATRLLLHLLLFFPCSASRFMTTVRVCCCTGCSSFCCLPASCSALPLGLLRLLLLDLLLDLLLNLLFYNLLLALLFHFALHSALHLLLCLLLCLLLGCWLLCSFATWSSATCFLLLCSATRSAPPFAAETAAQFARLEERPAKCCVAKSL